MGGRNQQRRAPCVDDALPPPEEDDDHPADPPLWPDELTLAALCAAAVSAACDASDNGLVTDSLVAELADAPPPADEDALAARVADVALGLDLDDDQVPSTQLASALWRELEAWRAAQVDTGELLPDGCCELCERRMPLTRHHLVPRSQHAAHRARGATQAQLSLTLACCRQCHNAVHAAADEATLGERYASRDALLRLPPLARFVAWAAKQRGRDHGSHLLPHKR